jgi:GNAT superfamily N-acetyltransferase
METAPVVRLAVKEDYSQIMSLFRMFYKENALCSWAEDKIQSIITSGIAGNHAIIGVIGPIKSPVAMIYLCVGELWYSHDPILLEQGFFVHPDHRKSSYAKSLLDFAKAAANQTGLPLLMGIVSNTKTEQKIRLCRRQLGDPAGAYFLWNGKTGK